MAENDILGVPQWWIWVAVGVVIFIAVVIAIIVSLTANRSSKKKRKELNDALKKIETAQEKERAARPQIVSTTPAPQVRQRSDTIFENV